MCSCDLQEFIAGYHCGLKEATQGVNANVPLSDEEIITNIKDIFNEIGQLNSADLRHCIGDLIGQITGRW